jgi:hypothetical protein
MGPGSVSLGFLGPKSPVHSRLNRKYRQGRLTLTSRRLIRSRHYLPCPDPLILSRHRTGCFGAFRNPSWQSKLVMARRARIAERAQFA